MHLVIDLALIFAIFILAVSVIKTLLNAPLSWHRLPVSQLLVMAVFFVLLALYGF